MVNGKTSDINITVRGSDWYWAVCAVMTTAALVFSALSHTKPRPQRLFHYITAGICFTAAIAYFSMGSNLGWTPIDVQFRRSDSKVSGINREIFYVRYIDWFITTPLLLMDLMLTAGMPWPTILWTIFMDWVMIVCGLVGALVKSSYKWGYFTFGKPSNSIGMDSFADATKDVPLSCTSFTNSPGSPAFTPRTLVLT